jgi:hypothetical protein
MVYVVFGNELPGLKAGAFKKFTQIKSVLLLAIRWIFHFLFLFLINSPAARKKINEKL